MQILTEKLSFFKLNAIPVTWKLAEIGYSLNNFIVNFEVNSKRKMNVKFFGTKY